MNGLNEEREKLIQRIECVRVKLNRSIDEKEDYATVYQYSVELDAMIEQKMAAGYKRNRHGPVLEITFFDCPVGGRYERGEIPLLSNKT